MVSVQEWEEVGERGSKSEGQDVRGSKGERERETERDRERQRETKH